MSGKISNIILLALIVVTLVVMGLFYFGGGSADIPKYTGLAINWAKVLLYAAIIIALLFFVYKIIADPKSSIKSLLGIALLGVIFFITYNMGDPTPLNLPSYDGPDNVASRLKLADMMLYTSLIFFIGTLAALVIGQVLKWVRN